MKCKYCQSEIDARAKVCPHCRRKQSNDGLIIALVLIGSFLFLLIGIPFFKGFSAGYNNKDTSVSVGAPTAAPTEAPEESTVIYDKDGIKISYIGLSQGSEKAKINLLIENDSDKGRMIQARDFSINGFMANEIFSADVAAQKKCYDSIDVYNRELEENKITEIKDIEFHFIIAESDNWSQRTESEAVKITVN